MKKVFVVVVIMMFALGVVACGIESENIEGYWMTEEGETVSFNSNGKAIIDGFSYDYSIYAENNLSISSWGDAEEYRFDIDGDILSLIDLDSNKKIVFYRDEDKQAEIKNQLKLIATEKEQQKRMQQEIEEKERNQKEYENYINRLERRIEEIDSEIMSIQKNISNNESYISENRDGIQEEQNSIDELEKEITQLQCASEEVAQGDIEYLMSSQEYHYGCIEYYNEQIEYYNNQIFNYKQEIIELENEKQGIIKELGEE